jgi:hypothetical protein
MGWLDGRACPALSGIGIGLSGRSRRSRERSESMGIGIGMKWTIGRAKGILEAKCIRSWIYRENGADYSGMGIEREVE